MDLKLHRALIGGSQTSLESWKPVGCQAHPLPRREALTATVSTFSLRESHYSLLTRDLSPIPRQGRTHGCQRSFQTPSFPAWPAGGGCDKHPLGSAVLWRLGVQEGKAGFCPVRESDLQTMPTTELRATTEFQACARPWGPEGGKEPATVG